MTQTIAITTPTGNVGSKLVERLVQRAESHDLQLVLLARKPEKLRHLCGPRVRVEGGRLEDARFLVRATRDVDALFWATPNSFAPELTMRQGYRLFARAAATAIVANEIAHTVHLSGFAHVNDGGGEQSLFGSLADSEVHHDAHLARHLGPRGPRSAGLRPRGRELSSSTPVRGGRGAEGLGRRGPSRPLAACFPPWVGADSGKALPGRLS